MVEGKTESGFEFKIDETVVNSMEFYDIMADLKDAADKEAANPNDVDAGMASVQAKRNYEILLLGKAQRDALIKHCKGENGVTDVTVFQDELQQILAKAHGKLKNS